MEASRVYGASAIDEQLDGLDQRVLRRGDSHRKDDCELIDTYAGRVDQLTNRDEQRWGRGWRVVKDRHDCDGLGWIGGDGCCSDWRVDSVGGGDEQWFGIYRQSDQRAVMDSSPG